MDPTLIRSKSTSITQDITLICVLYHGHPHKYPAQFFKDVYEEFEDAKGVIRIRKSKDRQQINNQTF
jgi:hypothetical protein